MSTQHNDGWSPVVVVVLVVLRIIGMMENNRSMIVTPSTLERRPVISIPLCCLFQKDKAQLPCLFLQGLNVGGGLGKKGIVYSSSCRAYPP